MEVSSLDQTQEFRHRIATRDARIGIVGLGYVGLPLALLFSEARFRITGFDVDAVKVEMLNQGRSYIVRIPGTEIQLAQISGFSATVDFRRVAELDVVIICVPTPLNQNHEPDLSYVIQTVNSIAPHLREGQVVILESTTYPGTTEEVVVPLLEQGNPAGLRLAREEGMRGFYVAFSPEREDTRQRLCRPARHPQGGGRLRPGGARTSLRRLQ